MAAEQLLAATTVSVSARQQRLEALYPKWHEHALDSLLDKVAAEFPDRTLVTDDWQTFTYQSIVDWSRRLAAGLQNEGVRAGDHVAIIVGNCAFFVALKFALSRIGAVAVPLNILNRDAELLYLLDQSDSVLLITMDEYREFDFVSMLSRIAPGWESGRPERLPQLRSVLVLPTSERQLGPHVRSVRELEQRGRYTGLSLAAAEAVCDIIYTSGTTGPPKGVMLTHDQLLRTAFGSAYGRAFDDGRKVGFALPMYHVFGYVEGLLAVLFVGGSISVQAKFEPRELLRRVEVESITDLLAVPAMTLALIEAQQETAVNLSSATAMLSSGTRAPARVWDEIGSVLGIAEVTTGYGMTEVTASATVTRPDDPPDKVRTTNGRLRRVGPAGVLELDGKLVDYRVVDPVANSELPRGQVGELRAKGPGVTTGYYKKPTETAAAFDDEGWLHTGDLGSIDDDDYVRLVGRLKESYRCGGEQVLPTEIEDLITSRAEVLQAHVVPVPDDRMGEVGAAFVVLAAGASLDAAAIAEMCASNLARFKVPKHVFLVAADEIPVTASGRARKFLLTELAKKRLERI